MVIKMNFSSFFVTKGHIELVDTYVSFNQFEQLSFNFKKFLGGFLFFFFFRNDSFVSLFPDSKKEKKQFTLTQFNASNL